MKIDPKKLNIESVLDDIVVQQLGGKQAEDLDKILVEMPKDVASLYEQHRGGVEVGSHVLLPDQSTGTVVLIEHLGSSRLPVVWVKIDGTDMVVPFPDSTLINLKHYKNKKPLYSFASVPGRLVAFELLQYGRFIHPDSYATMNCEHAHIRVFTADLNNPDVKELLFVLEWESPLKVAQAALSYPVPVSFAESNEVLPPQLALEKLVEDCQL